MAEASNSAAAAPESITVQTCDGEQFKVRKELAMESGIMQNFFDEDAATAAKESVIPLPNATSHVFSKAISYLERLHTHKLRGLEPKDEEVKKFQADLLTEDRDMKIDMVNLADYLDIKGLYDALTTAIAETIKAMTVEEVREFFDIENDFTPEEEQRIREENTNRNDEL